MNGEHIDQVAFITVLFFLNRQFICWLRTNLGYVDGCSFPGSERAQLLPGLEHRYRPHAQRHVLWNARLLKETATLVPAAANNEKLQY